MRDQLVIVAPAVAHEQAFLEMVADFDRRDVENADFYRDAQKDFAAYVQGLLAEEAGWSLPEALVPCAHRWLLDGAGAVVAVARLRHRIDTPFLEEEAGHVGYDVAPAHRGKGYGHAALQAALAEARRVGLDRVLLVADEDNTASRAVIEKQGGQLEEVVLSDFWDRRICRYWITVLAAERPTVEVTVLRERCFARNHG